MDLAHAHEDLFTSGAYLAEFRPDAAGNPFASIYAAKREVVLASVEGEDRQILDVGGGMGRMSIPLSLRHFVTLCDLSQDMLDLARPHAGRRLELAVGDARDLPFPDARYDCVLAIDVMPHLPNPEVALAEFRRVLRPGGRLVIDSTNSVPFWTLAYPGYVGRRPARWLRTLRAGGVLPEWRDRVRHLRRRTFLRLLTEAGFEVESVRHFGPAGCPKWHLAVASAP